MGIDQFFFVFPFLIAAVATENLQPTMQAQNSARPHLTGCFSRELMTFHCQWDVGSFHNLTEPRDLRLFYMLEKDSKVEEGKWSECPNYSTTVENECFFDASHTVIWYHYAIQLRSRNQDVVYDESFFSVENIVFPDPPVGLNWTLLNMGPTGLLYDVVVSWEPPASAVESVQTGWMLLFYETQYREKGSEDWKTMDNGKETQAYIYGLNSNSEYEVQVRAKMRGYNFGEFSESIFILVSSKESRIPITAVLIFASIVIGIILMLIAVSRQQKLMVIFLPPIPGPKIKGVDTVLLEKGQLTEFTSILGTHPCLRPEFFSNDPWVEFIEVDIDEPHETLDGFETPLLFGDSPVSRSPPMSSGFRDDDSGRASCCDPDLSDHDHTDVHQPSTSAHDGFHTLSPTPSTASQPVVTPTLDVPWPRSMYSQVTQVTAHGETILSPEQRDVTDNCNNKDKAHKNEDNKKWKEPQLITIPDESGYTSDMDARIISEQHSVGEQSEPSSPTAESLPFAEHTNSLLQDNPDPTVKPDSTPGVSSFPILTIPTPEYTMVDGVDWQNGLLLKPNIQAECPLAIRKALPSPEGYLTADLLHSISQ